MASPFISAALTKEDSQIPAISPLDIEKKEESLKRVSSDSLQYKSGFLGGVPMDKPRPLEKKEGILSPMNYLTNILSANVYDVAIESPLHYAPKLSQGLGVHLWLKREDLQPVSPLAARFIRFT
ncbi:hypothetical protein AAC387_Pa11g1036 [Persea americana]